MELRCPSHICTAGWFDPENGNRCSFCGIIATQGYIDYQRRFGAFSRHMKVSRRRPRCGRRSVA